MSENLWPAETSVLYSAACDWAEASAEVARAETQLDALRRRESEARRMFRELTIATLANVQKASNP